MRTIYLFAFGLLMCSLQVHAQEQCIKEVECSVGKQVNYTFISESELSDFSSFNLGYYRPYSTTYVSRTCMDENGSFHNVKTFSKPAYNAAEWATGIFKIENHAGTISLFDVNNQLIHVSDPSDYDMSSYESMSTNEMDWLGLEMTVILPDAEEELLLEEEGLTVFRIDESEVLIKGGDLEWILNVENQTTVRREYDEGQLVHSETIKVLPISDSTAIPLYRIVEEYKEVAPSTFLETSTSEVYFNCTIDGQTHLQTDLAKEEQEVPYIGHSNDLRRLERYSELVISPNPATTNLTLSLPFPGVDRKMNVEIMDLMGNIIYTSNTYQCGEDLSLDISTWNTGVYIVNANYNGRKIIKRFIKE